MKKIIPTFVILVPFSFSPLVYAEDEGGSASVSVYVKQAKELMRGLTFINGNFVATHTLNSSSDSPSVLGYPDASHLPPSGPLLATFNAFGWDPNGIEGFLSQFLEDEGYSSVEEWAEYYGVPPEMLAGWRGYNDPAVDYFNNLSPLEQASLYRALAEEDNPKAASLLKLQYGYAWGLGDLPRIESLLNNLPSGEAGNALNSLGKSLQELNLSGLNLSGWDTAGKNLFMVNLVGSNVTVAQLNGASYIHEANLSELNLTDWDTTERDLSGVNFVGSNVTAAQLNAAGDILWVYLSGTGITRADLESANKWSDWMLDTITF
jgi:uncharacterized protein YjbI with pentapeptide repeats